MKRQRSKCYHVLYSVLKRSMEWMGFRARHDGSMLIIPQQRGWGRRITSSGRPAWATPWGLHWLKNKGKTEKLKTQLFVVNHRRKFKVYYMGLHEHGGTADGHRRHRSSHTVALMSPNVSPGPRHFPSLTSSRQNTSYRTSASVNELEEQCW